jgi:hypothetical protein
LYKASSRRGRIVSALLVLVLGCALCSCSEWSSAPLPPGLSASARERLLSEALAPSSILAGMNEYRRLRVNLDHFVPDSEWETIVEDCVMTHTPSTALSSQEASDITEGCELRFPPERLRHEIRSNSEWTYEYRYLNNFYVPCLRLHGVAGRALPSLAKYLAAADAFRAPIPSSFLGRQVNGVQRSVVAAECASTAPALG